MHPYQHFIGIDSAAETFAAAIYHAEQKVRAAVDPIANTPDGFVTFEHWLHTHAVDPRTTVICVEATGVYCEHLCYWLHTRGWQVTVVSPHKVKRSSDRRAKTDLLDAQQIAEYAWRYHDKLVTWQPNDAIVEQISVLLSTREQLSGQLTANRNALKAVERKYIDTPAARRIYSETIAHLVERIKQLDGEIKQLIDNHPTLATMAGILLSVPGVGLLLAANLTVLTRGFRQIPQYRHLASYLGICPYPHQSGSSVDRRARSAGFGPARMRKLLYLASLSLRRNDARFRHYYDRKVAEGKVGRLVINNIANKLLRILCGILSKKEPRPYHATYRSVKPAVNPAT
jgi:transposase